MESQKEPLSLYIVAAPEDRTIQTALERQLIPLQKQNLLVNEQHVLPGSDVDAAFKRAGLIVLLISADFYASKTCQEQMQYALERQQAGMVQVIAILARATDIQNASFLYCPVLPTNNKPVTNWPDQDAALQHITAGIRAVLKGNPLPEVYEGQDAGLGVSQQIQQANQSAIANSGNAITTNIQGNQYDYYDSSDSFSSSPVKRVMMVPDVHNSFFASIALESRNPYWYEAKEPIKAYDPSNPVIHFSPGSDKQDQTKELRYFYQQWKSTYPRTRKYPFKEICSQQFYVADFVRNVDISFDITLFNMKSSPLILSEVGIEVIKVCHLMYYYGIPKAVKIPITASYIVDLSQISKELWKRHRELEEENSEVYKGMIWIGEGDAYKEGPIIDVHKVISVSLPDPLYLPKKAPYRYTLFLKEYRLLNNAIIRMWARTHEGEERSHAIYLFSS